MRRKKQATKVRAYLNEKQQQFLSMATAFRCWIGGRGCGKSTAIGWSTLHKVKEMPGSAGILTCLTMEQLKTNSLTSIKKVWKIAGMVENHHFICFKKPPDAWINRSIAPPDEFKNVIFFYNGAWIKCVSAKMYDAARGGSYDWAEIDEAGFFKEIFYTQVLAASIRGNRGRWNSSRHQQVSFYSSMPTTQSGKWLLKFETLMGSDPADFFYQEATAYDNIHVYGEKNLERMRKLIPYLTFQVEFMNMRVNQTEFAYYNAFSDSTHLYGDMDPDIRDINYNPNKHLCLTFDFGGWFSCLGVLQDFNNTEFLLDEFDARKNESIKDLCNKFADAYESHKLKRVKVYGEPRGHDATAFGKSQFQEVRECLEARGWIVEVLAMATPSDSHQLRHTAMNELLREENDRLPRLRIHRHRCKDTIIAMQITEATPDFKKNKKTEKDKKFPQQHAAHHTDKLDYYIFQKYGWRFGFRRSIMGNSAGF